MLREEKLTETIIGAAIEVHRTLGPGLLERVYLLCLNRELGQLGLCVKMEVELPVRYKGESLDCNYRADMIVQETVLIELKSVESILPVHEAQLLTYLRLSGLKIGLLLNFGAAALKDDIVRRVL